MIWGFSGKCNVAGTIHQKARWIGTINTVSVSASVRVGGVSSLTNLCSWMSSDSCWITGIQWHTCSLWCVCINNAEIIENALLYATCPRFFRTETNMGHPVSANSLRRWLQWEINAGRVCITAIVHINAVVFKTEGGVLMCNTWIILDTMGLIIYTNVEIVTWWIE